MLLFARCRARSAWVGMYGTAKRWRTGSSGSMGSPWACDNASVCSGGWTFDCANHVPQSRKPIPNGRRRIKKLQALMENGEVDLWAADEVHFQQHGSRCRMWVPPETRIPCCCTIRRAAA